MGEDDFESGWAEGAALSTDEAIAYAQRGRAQRKRPTSGWASLTPTERDVVRLVSEGLANNDIATRLFVSPRTVQTHLTHVYTNSASPPSSRTRLHGSWLAVRWLVANCHRLPALRAALIVHNRLDREHGLVPTLTNPGLAPRSGWRR